MRHGTATRAGASCRTATPVRRPQDRRRSMTDGVKCVNGQEPVLNDEFDFTRLRVMSDFAEATGVQKMLLTVPVKKPDRQWFVRVHPLDDYRMQVGLLELKDERVAYLI